MTYSCKWHAASGAYVYISANTSTTYLLNTTSVHFDVASQTCRSNGGELVYYTNLREQLEVSRLLQHADASQVVTAWLAIVVCSANPSSRLLLS